MLVPENIKMNIFLALPIDTGLVERSFSHLKVIKTRLHSHLSDCSVAYLMKILIEGPEIDAVEFEEYWRFFWHNHRILLGQSLCVDFMTDG